MTLEGHEINVSTRFTCTTRAGQGAKYLNSGEIDKRSGVEVAIACLFSALFQAQEGASEEEIEECLSASYRTWEHYAELARSRFKGRSVRGEKSTKIKALPKAELETDYVNLDEPIEPSIKPAEQTSDGLDSWESATDENLDDEEIAL